MYLLKCVSQCIMGNRQQVFHWQKKRTKLVIDVLSTSLLSAYLLMSRGLVDISDTFVRKADRNKYGSNALIQQQLIFSNHIVGQFLYAPFHFIVLFLNYLCKKILLQKQVWNPSIQSSVSRYFLVILELDSTRKSTSNRLCENVT